VSTISRFAKKCWLLKSQLPLPRTHARTHDGAGSNINIKTGKQARAADDSKKESAPLPKNAGASAPAAGAGNAPAAELGRDAYSVAAGDAHNRAAQAGNVAAHAVEPQQQKGKKRIDESTLSKLVAEENESKSKFPTYQGLERWKLLEKMGDGAFSNVYRAKDLEGTHGEVAIKVVRKYEMNNMQVSFYQRARVSEYSISRAIFPTFEPKSFFFYVQFANRGDD
jgi:hypothetical protein